YEDCYDKGVDYGCLYEHEAEHEGRSDLALCLGLTGYALCRLAYGKAHAESAAACGDTYAYACGYGFKTCCIVGDCGCAVLSCGKSRARKGQQKCQHRDKCYNSSRYFHVYILRFIWFFLFCVQAPK